MNSTWTLVHVAITPTSVYGSILPFYRSPIIFKAVASVFCLYNYRSVPSYTSCTTCIVARLDNFPFRPFTIYCIRNYCKVKFKLLKFNCHIVRISLRFYVYRDMDLYYKHYIRSWWYLQYMVSLHILPY